MTTIIAVENADHIILGCDTQVTAGYQKASLPEPKIFSNGDYRIAVAGRFRMLQALQHAELPPLPTGWQDKQVDWFVANELNRAVSKIEKNAGCDAGDSVYLFVVGGRVYNIHGDGTFLRTATGVYALGSGAEYALGALYGLSGRITEKDVKNALRAAAYNDIHTSAPFHVERINK